MVDLGKPVRMYLAHVTGWGFKLNLDRFAYHLAELILGCNHSFITRFLKSSNRLYVIFLNMPVFKPSFNPIHLIICLIHFKEVESIEILNRSNHIYLNILSQTKL